MLYLEKNLNKLEEELNIAVQSSGYILVDVPGDTFEEREEVYNHLIQKFKNSYDESTIFEPHDCSLFPRISNFNALCYLPIRFFYKILFETDVLVPKILSDRNDAYFISADMNLLQALYFHKTFIVDSMTDNEYQETFTLLCLVDPNILLQPIDVEDLDGFWDLIPFIDYCSKFGYAISHIGKALSILEKEDKDIVKQFIASNIYNFKAFKPLLQNCSKNFLLNIPDLIPHIPDDILRDYYSYVNSK